MGFCFSSPDKKELLADSREYIESNARVLSVCTELAEGELRVGVERVYDAVRYMTPTAVAGATQADKKIGALAGDLKIVLSKGGNRSIVQAEDILKDLNVAVAERNSFTK
ncbi:MAG: hypothetical protein K2M48_05585 [Clostridiales bacterium]|nr:hypothetical protein [Clostridiales bacterium]